MRERLKQETGKNKQTNKAPTLTPHHQDSCSGSSLVVEHFFPHRKGQVEKASLGGRKSMKTTFQPSYYTQ